MFRKLSTLTFLTYTHSFLRLTWFLYECVHQKTYRAENSFERYLRLTLSITLFFLILPYMYVSCLLPSVISQFPTANCFCFCCTAFFCGLHLNLIPQQNLYITAPMVLMRKICVLAGSSTSTCPLSKSSHCPSNT